MIQKSGFIHIIIYKLHTYQYNTFHVQDVESQTALFKISENIPYFRGLPRYIQDYYKITSLSSWSLTNKKCVFFYELLTG